MAFSIVLIGPAEEGMIRFFHNIWTWDEGAAQLKAGRRRITREK
jgi:hypothetical protein